MRALLSILMTAVLLMTASSCREGRRVAVESDGFSPLERAEIQRERARRDSISRLVEEASSAEIRERQRRFLAGEDDGEHERYLNDGHPGTKPDDPLFGFDPWDDEDDAYDVERNQIDPYPDEW